ncbi:MAG TPA: phage Gp37/Gp68 family protein [Mesorhizobium sp.]|jgi:protein gp37|uniref:phage Gp37/Gp68 family protein n=1 Tax=Mesorhizobium sp. TaxID=1871066 RepID=UPI002DDCC7AC|nr:phage Gp37/Gp68 family protein [Mesorhizobium sp.]HEV2504440.1 phage Gp37/Gp68 family protein [Mesorhizobium sp.]
MADGTHIEWTDATWNPITGCDIVSAGCKICYAMKLAGTRLRHHPSRAGLTKDTKAGPVWTGEVRFNDEWVDQPLRWKKPRRIFVCAHGDLFAENVPDEWIDRVFAVMALAPQHTFQVLTKRAARMRMYLTERDARQRWRKDAVEVAGMNMVMDGTVAQARVTTWPLPNVWLGVSAEDQKRADERVPDLLYTPAAIRFVSAEPLLGPIDFRRISVNHPTYCGVLAHLDALTGQMFDLGGTPIDGLAGRTRLHQIIVGGESGANARPMHPAWPSAIHNHCSAAGTAFFFKQWGLWGPSEPRAGSHEQFALAIDGTLYRSVDLAYPDGARRAAAIRAGHDQAQFHAMYRVGKRLSGRILDGVEYSEQPQVRS